MNRGIAQIKKLLLNSCSRNNLPQRFCNTLNISAYEPPYLKNMKPKLPVYEALTIQIKGYDFTVLETFQKFAHHMALFMNFKSEDAWANPGKKAKIDRFKPGTTVVETTFELMKYERDIKLINIPATRLAVYAEVLQTALPEGTELKIFPFSEEHHNERYVPNHDLNFKVKELKELGGAPNDVEPLPEKII